MSGRKKNPGDPYDVGHGKPPKETRYEKGVSGNPNGRPRKKPDLYTELRRVLDEPMTVTVQGENRRVTFQQALLLRLRDQALRGDVWASKLIQKVIDAIPEGSTEYDHIDLDVGVFRAKEWLRLMVEESQRKNDNQNAESKETNDGE